MRWCASRPGCFPTVFPIPMRGNETRELEDAGDMTSFPIPMREGVDATIDFTISLNRATNRRFTVNVLFSSGTADFSDIEFVQTEQSVTSRRATMKITRSRHTNEPSETFSMILQSPELTTDYLILAEAPGIGTILNTETLTASFENVPQDHDGSTAFTFNVAFTNDVSIGAGAMRDHAFTVTDGDDAVTITLPGNRACATQGAICSDEDNPVQLSNSPSATVAAPPEGDPLTASFSNVPDDHDGGDFFVDLTFSEGPDVGYRDVQKAVKVNGGSINRANTCPSYSSGSALRRHTRGHRSVVSRSMPHRHLADTPSPIVQKFVSLFRGFRRTLPSGWSWMSPFLR